MFINFYKVSPDARSDYMELCPISTEKASRKSKTRYDFEAELNRKIRRGANLGKKIIDEDRFSAFVYYDMMFIVKDYTIVMIDKTDLYFYPVSRAYKNLYDMIEEKVTNKRANRDR